MEKRSNYEIFNTLLNTDIAKLKAQYSIVNKNERTPSLWFYYNEMLGDWFFKDFSSNEHGGPVKYLALRDNISFDEARRIIRNLDCRSYNRTIPQIKKANEYRYDIVKYNDDDIRYWARYYIDKSMLIKHNVYPIINFSINNFVFDNRWIGYFNNRGELIQVYAPANSIYNTYDKKKIMTIKPNSIYYLNNHTENLIITKSKKDMIVLDMLFGKKFSYVAWTAESIKIENDIRFMMLRSKYKNVFINYDNDTVGLKKIKDLAKYNVKPLIVREYKDISDYICNVGLTNVKNVEEIFIKN